MVEVDGVEIVTPPAAVPVSSRPPPALANPMALPDVTGGKSRLSAFETELLEAWAED